MHRTQRMATDHPELVLGRYRLGELIAAGGTARVHRAHDTQLDRPVAVKLLHAHLLPDENARRRFAAEARAAAGLRHPAIVTVYDVEADAEAPAIVMELVEGASLSAHVAASGAMPARDVARLGAEVADALYLAHRQGVVHRDVKPGNILLERATGRARLVDFGIAHSLEAEAASLTQTGTSLGTPRYMAPEQLAGETVGPRTDLWGLGAALHEALTGRPPFDGTTPVAIARQQQEGPSPMEGVDPGLAAIVSTCLAPRIEDRPLHAGALADALRGWLGEREGETTLATPVVPTLVPADAGVTQAAATQTAAPRGDSNGPGPVARRPPARPRRRRATALLAAVVGAVVLLAVALAAGVGREVARDPAPPSPTPAASPDWRTPLLAAYRDACDERLDASEIRGLSPDEARAVVEGRIAKCEDAAAEASGPGPARDGGGSGKGKAKGKGKGRGG